MISTSRSPISSRSRSSQSKYLISSFYGTDPPSVIREMLSGVDISLVDPDLYPSLVPYIRNFMDSFRAKHDTKSLRTLEFYLQYIEQFPHRQEISNLLKPKPKPIIVKMPVLSEQQVKLEVDLILNSEEIKTYPQEELELVICGLRQKRQEFINEGDYMAAQKAEHFSRILISHGQLGTVEEMQYDRVSELESKCTASRIELENNKKKWEGLFQNLCQQCKDELKQLEKDHAQEIQEIEDKRNQAIPPSFQKYSNLLLQYRAREKAMLATRRYADASYIKELADELQENEDRDIKLRWNSHIDNRIKKKKRIQRRQLEIRKSFWKKEKQNLVKEANIDISQAEAAIVHLETNLESAKNALNIASNLKEETKTVREEDLPKLDTARKTSKPQEYRQRQILNSKIYTRQTRSQLSSPRKK